MSAAKTGQLSAALAIYWQPRIWRVGGIRLYCIPLTWLVNSLAKRSSSLKKIKNKPGSVDG